jgi:hypothetical protein
VFTYYHDIVADYNRDVKALSNLEQTVAKVTGKKDVTLRKSILDKFDELYQSMEPYTKKIRILFFALDLAETPQMELKLLFSLQEKAAVMAELRRLIPHCTDFESLYYNADLIEKKPFENDLQPTTIDSLNNGASTSANFTLTRCKYHVLDNEQLAKWLPLKLSIPHRFYQDLLLWSPSDHPMAQKLQQ